MNENLIKFRKEQGLSQVEMAVKLGISKSFYEKIESGARNPSYNFICRFKDIFDGEDADSIFFAPKDHVTCSVNSKAPRHKRAG